VQNGICDDWLVQKNHEYPQITRLINKNRPKILPFGKRARAMDRINNPANGLIGTFAVFFTPKTVFWVFFGQSLF
jgi:hypothetical protein